MDIESAQYVADADGNNISIVVTHDDGEICYVPVGGATWQNAEVNAWVTGGGKIAAASSS